MLRNPLPSEHTPPKPYRLLPPMVSAAGHVSVLGFHLANHTMRHTLSFSTATLRYLTRGTQQCTGQLEIPCKHQRPPNCQRQQISTCQQRELAHI